MATYKMKYGPYRKKNGYIGEVIGFHEKYIFQNDFKKPVLIEKGIATFELKEGKRYIIKNTGEKQHTYHKIEYGKIVPISEEEVRKYLIGTGHTPIKSKTSFAKPIQETFKNEYVFSVSKEIEYIISNLDEAFKCKEVGDIEIYYGITAAVWNFAITFDFQKDFISICTAFKDGLTSEDIKRKFTTHINQGNTPFSRASILEKYNVPEFV